jgi:hypothetical protein
MNLTQMHERLRLELLRRIQRGTVSVSLLARQTGIGQSHLSNFLRCKRLLSLEAADRVMAAQRISAADLSSSSAKRWNSGEEEALVPVVSHAAAIHEPFIRPAAVQGVVHLSGRLLKSLRAQASTQRRSWQRFVVITVTADEALNMAPVLMPEALVLLDRHYNALVPYHSDQATIYAIRHGTHLKLRYADFTLNRLVLRPHNLACPVDLIDVDPDESPRDLIAGRVALVMNEL